jgi:hypothetical protein
LLRAGAEGRELRVIVGPVPSNRTPPIVAPPVGLTVQSIFPSAGQLALPASATRTISLRLLAAPAAAATPVTVTSSNPAIATAVGPVEIPAGSTDAALTLATGAAGETVLLLRAGAEGRELRVIVGPVPSNRTPPIVAPPVGLSVQSIFPSAGQLALPASATRTISLRLLAAPAAGTTPVSVTSSDSGVAAVVGAVEIPAGSTDAELTLTTGAANGEAVLVLRAGAEGRELRVIVGPVASNRTAPVLAPPIGVQVEAP